MNEYPCHHLKEYPLRIAALILGLILSFGLFVQSALLATVESIDDALNDRKNESTGGAVGILVALIMLIAAALVMAKPRFSMWTFAVGAVVALLGGAFGDFSDLIIWGIASLVLALLAWRGSIEKREKDAEDRVGRDAIKQLAAQQQASGKEPEHSPGA